MARAGRQVRCRNRRRERGKQQEQGKRKGERDRQTGREVSGWDTRKGYLKKIEA